MGFDGAVMAGIVAPGIKWESHNRHQLERVNSQIFEVIQLLEQGVKVALLPLSKSKFTHMKLVNHQLVVLGKPRTVVQPLVSGSHVLTTFDLEHGTVLFTFFNGSSVRVCYFKGFPFHVPGICRHPEGVSVPSIG